MKIQWLLSLSILVLITSGCTKAKEPEFRSIGNFRLKKLGFDKSVVGIEVEFYNPNKFGLGIKEGKFDVSIDSLYLGTFTQDEAVNASKNSNFKVALTGEISMVNALQLDLKNISSREVLLKADGTIKAGKAGIFVNRGIHYQGKHRLEDIKF